MDKHTKKHWPNEVITIFILVSVLMTLLLISAILMLINSIIIKDDSSYSTQIEEVPIKYDEEIMPDGIYLYYVDGSYMTMGIMTTGKVVNNGRRAGRVNFYGITEFGDVSSSYETLFVEDVGGKSFTCIGRNYSLKYQDSGIISVIQTAEYEDLGTTLSFEGNYIYLYPFNEDSYTERGDEYD